MGDPDLCRSNQAPGKSRTCLPALPNHRVYELFGSIPTGLPTLRPCQNGCSHLLQCTGLDEYPTDDIVCRY
ncbi:hypothetical protein TNCV_2868611 [Trichonephila clavipes]|nr:hypothetical protein TNCV_2868611 [Trichonephila clavipes]